MKKMAGFLVFTSMLTSQNAHAQDLCVGYMGQTVQSRSFSDISAELPRNLTKDEYETTDQFHARIAAATLPDVPIIMDRRIENQTFPEPMAYDADSGMLKVRGSAFQWGTIDWWKIARSTGAGEIASVAAAWNVATVLERTSRETGRYSAANAFGVGRDVFRSTLITHGVFDREGSAGDTGFFVADADGVVGQMAMAPADARDAKVRLRFALAIRPKWPFIATGSYILMGPTFADPREITVQYEVIYADVLCGLVIDRGTVIASYVANDQLRPPTPSSGLFTR